MSLYTPTTRKIMHVMVKPAGAACNIACDYCYYLNGPTAQGAMHTPSMPLSLLENFIQQYIQQQRSERILFTWQGGEPTLMGLDFFRQVVALQARYAPAGVQIDNDLQTNGLLLDEEWARFLREQRFLVGLSIDGPARWHDAHRHNRAGRGTFSQVMKAVALLHRHGIPFTTLTCIHHDNADHPLTIYQFLRDEVASPLMQFIPVVARKPGYPFYYPPQDPRCAPGHPDAPVQPWSVSARQWGSFLCQIFDEWQAHDAGRHFVHYIEAAVAIWSGQPSPLCTLAPLCGKNLVLEKEGSLYACDHFVTPEYRLGNISNATLEQLAFSASQQQFGHAKEATLPAQCRRCPYQFACFGECPKHRFLLSEDHEPGLNYLCRGWHQFWSHIDQPMHTLLRRLGLPVRHGYPRYSMIDKPLL